MVGQNVERHPELLDEVRRRGHIAANHTHHHIRGLGLKAKDYLADAETCEKYTRTRLLRPPHGWLTPNQFKALKRRYKVVMYDLVTRDYSKKVDADLIVENVKTLARDGSIIVFHDSLKSYEKLKTALPASLAWLSGQGFQFSLLPTLP